MAPNLPKDDSCSWELVCVFITLPSLELEGATEFVPVVLELEGSALELEAPGSVLFMSNPVDVCLVKDVTDSWGSDRVNLSSLQFDDFLRFLPFDENRRVR